MPAPRSRIAFKANEPGNVARDLARKRRYAHSEKVEKIPIGYYRWVQMACEVMMSRPCRPGRLVDRVG